MNRDELHYAALENDIAQLAKLLEAGTDPNVRDKADWAPLHFAAQDNSFDTAQALVQAGADVNARNDHGNVPLWVAIMKGARRGETYVPMIKLLQEAGTDLQAPNNSGNNIVKMLGNVAWGNPDIMALFKDELPAS
ncbi:ankyrin repeat domain-containing protein [Gordonia sp. SID5947]|uniref:ankyrin repeat domain-containing protein n=1 Tax=Gordonia sp. SID5947 TaxID=2690315 RepID=UPI00137183F9|nr:ankyrin repeat domain-containing protein [Gordonia sp. SID5947]MYR07756.1 ankyrin repeat domain-containing protein [Gordonia sp. SID5947]